MKRILFLFNHDAAHQVAHLTGVARAMALDHPDIETIVAVAPPIAAIVAQQMGVDAVGRVTWITLDLPPLINIAGMVLDRLFPARRLARLRYFAPLFAGVDMLVSTERTCLRAKAHIRGRQPLFAAIPHGAGDRNVSYHADYTRFDVVLVAGAKVADAMRGIGVAADRLVIVGYPKFDTIAANIAGNAAARPTAKLFDNDRPVVVYNPHFDPHLSSWYDHGPAILHWFAGPGAGRFNLVFAPHVMLFRKRWHISPEYRTVRRRPDIPAEALGAANILVDVDGPRLFDMTYMTRSTIYLGDMSSQIYEFLQTPRAAIFIDSHDGRVTEPEANHLHWRAGPVASTIDDVVAQLGDWQAVADRYRAAQRQLFAQTFDISAVPATVRAARALVDAIAGR